MKSLLIISTLGLLAATSGALPVNQQDQSSLQSLADVYSAGYAQSISPRSDATGSNNGAVRLNQIQNQASAATSEPSEERQLARNFKANQSQAVEPQLNIQDSEEISEYDEYSNDSNNPRQTSNPAFSDYNRPQVQPTNRVQFHPTRTVPQADQQDEEDYYGNESEFSDGFNDETPMPTRAPAPRKPSADYQPRPSHTVSQPTGSVDEIEKEVKPTATNAATVVPLGSAIVTQPSATNAVNQPSSGPNATTVSPDTNEEMGMLKKLQDLCGFPDSLFSNVKNMMTGNFGDLCPRLFGKEAQGGALSATAGTANAAALAPQA